MRIKRLFIVFILFHCLLTYSEEQKRRIMPSRPYILMYGYNDKIRSRWTDTLNHVNIITGITEDAKFVKELRSRGIIFAYHVLAREAPGRMTAEELADYWISVLENDLDGELIGGFDAIAIDEVGQHDNTSGSRRICEALRITREKCPDRRIFVWGTWRTASGNALLPPFKTYDDVLSAVYRFADLFLYECYIREENHQFYLLTNSARNLNKRMPGLLNKTLYGLYISQSDPYIGDDSEKYDFKDLLDHQFYILTNDHIFANVGGIAFWPFYRARMDTIAHVNNLLEHYFLKGNITHYGDGNFRQIVRNSGFEDRGDWQMITANDGQLGIVRYRRETTVPNAHGPVSHGSHCLKMTREASFNVVRQLLKLKPNRWYTLSVFCYSPDMEATPEVRALDSSFSELPTSEEEKKWWSPWKMMLITFLTASDGEVWIELTDRRVPSGSTIYWDFVEVEECRGMNQPSEITEVKYSHNEDKVILIGKNFMPGSVLQVDDGEAMTVDWISRGQVTIQMNNDFLKAPHMLVLKKPVWCLHSHRAFFFYEPE